MIGVPDTTTFLHGDGLGRSSSSSSPIAFQQSRFGLQLRASRENERAARSVGVRVPVARAIAWVLSGFVVGVAGALYGHYFVTFSPLDFYFDITFLTIVMLIVGGMTSVTGAVVGVYFITFIRELLPPLGGRRARRRHAAVRHGEPRPRPVLLVTLILRPKRHHRRAGRSRGRATGGGRNGCASGRPRPRRRARRVTLPEPPFIGAQIGLEPEQVGSDPGVRLWGPTARLGSPTL